MGHFSRCLRVCGAHNRTVKGVFLRSLVQLVHLRLHDPEGCEAPLEEAYVCDAFVAHIAPLTNLTQLRK